ncbi:MAG TPA: efflux transporter outer membrane subunit [Rhodopila sp.]|nr:efflux transporter outer membrane subunit [Rhodopila sp.]HVZ08115.1 efflux transporter outer membrane subunit [Rhodopila sp.]
MAALLTLTACTVGPDFQKPTWAAPTSWFAGPRQDVMKVSTRAASTTRETPVDVNWWALFGDPKLTALEHRVAAENLDVKIAAARVAQSRDQLGIVQSAQFPTLDGNASYVRQKASDNGIFVAIPSAAGASGASGATTGGVQGKGVNAFDIYQGGFDASWEIDLWGRIRRGVESATASSTAAEDAQRGVLLSMMAEVARDYIQLRGVQAQLQIARDNVKIAQQSLSLTQQRAAGGVTTDLDVANASAQLRATVAEIPVLQQQEAELINAMSFLLGQPPNALRAELEVPNPVPPVPRDVPVGVPSELARRRPDIREAEAKLHAATADIGVAQADFYPTVTFNGSVGLQSLQWSHAFDLNSRQYAFGPGLTIPLFEGGRLRATLHLREAQQEEAALTYQKTVLQAWREVDDALTAYQAQQARREQLVQAVADNRKALALAQDRYAQGVSGFLDVLTAQRSLLQTQQELQRSTTQVSDNLVVLYKALGGGWENDLPLQQADAAQAPPEQKLAAAP